MCSLSPARLFTPSFAYALDRRFFTVPAEIPMCRAISAFDYPRHASMEITNSVVVRLAATVAPEL